MAEMRDSDEVEQQFDEANAACAEGSNRYPGMTYDQGVRDALAWVLGESDDAPYDDIEEQ